MNSAKRLLPAVGFLALLLVSMGWTYPETSEKKHFFVVLDSAPVLQYQQEISGKAPIQSSPFKAKQAQANGYEKRLSTLQDNLASQIQSRVPNAQVIGRFTQLVNALEVEADTYAGDTLQTIPGVSRLAPIRYYKPMLTVSNDLMGVSQAWLSVGGKETAGQGVFIADIDTGVDITHPCFDDTGYTLPDGFPKGQSKFTNKKVIAARVFPPSSGPRGNTTPYDYQGHGTHVSSIIASGLVDSPLGRLSGIAPKAYIGNYKVFTLDTADNAQIIRAIEQAVLDGVNVINLSLGSDVVADPQHDLFAQAIQNAIDLGVTVTIAVGNSSRSGVVGNPQQVEDAISVGSLTNAHQAAGYADPYDLQITAVVNGKTTGTAISALLGTNGGPFTQPILGTFPILDLDRLDGGGYGSLQDGIACEDIQLATPLYGWVLVQRGNCYFTDKVNRIMNLGGQGVLFYDSQDNSSTDLLQPQVDNTSIPSIMISRADGLLLKQYINSGGSVQIDIHGTPDKDKSSVPNLYSTYNSYGFTANHALKPEVVAVGEGSYGAEQNDIPASVSFVANGFEWMQGTSFAAPRAAGLTALLKQKYPHWPPAWIKSAVIEGAKRPVYLANNTSQAATLYQCGAGRINADESLLVDTLAVPAILSFGIQMVYQSTSQTKEITIVNVSGQRCEYTLESSNAANSSRFTVSPTAFTLEADAKIDVAVTWNYDFLIPDGNQEGGVILTNLTTGKTYTIPCGIQVKMTDAPTGDILLVDDDDGENFESYYTSCLEKIGTPYTYWDVKRQGAYPAYSYLTAFKRIIWFLSKSSLNTIQDTNSIEFALAFNPRNLFENDLMQYLGEGGALFLSGQDYFDQQETSAFSTEVLRLTMTKHDIAVQTVQGINRNPIGDGLGPFTLTFPKNYDNLPDYLQSLDTESVQPAFYAGGNQNQVIGVTVNTCSYRVVFLAFPLEVLDINAGTTILQTSLEWLKQGNYTKIQLDRVTPSVINKDDGSGPYTLSLEGQGLSIKTGYRAYLDAIPLTDVKRTNCNTLTGVAPADIQPGTYTLRVICGDGHRFNLKQAVQVIQGSSTPVENWSRWDWVNH